jgi:hypothetical protein
MRSTLSVAAEVDLPSRRATAAGTRGPGRTFDTEVRDVRDFCLFGMRLMSADGRPTGRGPQRGTTALDDRFPWGTLLGAAALGLAVVGVLTFAVLNAGAAAPDRVGSADDSVPGLDVAQTVPGQAHEPGPLQYDRSPSWGGAHNSAWTTCTGQVYEEQVPEEHATHSMEHGAVWITYRPDLPTEQVQGLAALVDGVDYRFLSPNPGQRDPISAQAWGRQLVVDDASDERLTAFAVAFTNGPQTPERGATCASGTPATGQDPEA